mgnify:CR=1 FL=1
MIFLIGVDHQIQQNVWDGNKAGREDLINYLINQSKLLKITLIAEEFSEQALGSGTQITAQEAAKILGIEHRLCDPDLKERITLNIKTSADRENIWLERIKDKLGSEMIFICGSDHVLSFESLLKKNKIGVKILKETF